MSNSIHPKLSDYSVGWADAGLSLPTIHSGGAPYADCNHNGIKLLTTWQSVTCIITKIITFWVRYETIFDVGQQNINHSKLSALKDTPQIKTASEHLELSIRAHVNSIDTINKNNLNYLSTIMTGIEFPAQALCVQDGYKGSAPGGSSPPYHHTTSRRGKQDNVCLHCFQAFKYRLNPKQRSYIL